MQQINEALEMKSKYKGKEHNGYRWFWYDSKKKRHHFQKELPRKGFTPQWGHIICTTEMLENGDFEYMAENGLTYTR